MYDFCYYIIFMIVISQVFQQLLNVKDFLSLILLWNCFVSLQWKEAKEIFSALKSASQGHRSDALEKFAESAKDPTLGAEFVKLDGVDFLMKRVEDGKEWDIFTFQTSSPTLCFDKLSFFLIREKQGFTHRSMIFYSFKLVILSLTKISGSPEVLHVTS